MSLHLAASLLWLVPAGMALLLAAHGRPAWQWRPALRAGGAAAWCVTLTWAVLRALGALPAVRGLIGWESLSGVREADTRMLTQATMWLRLCAGIVFAAGLLASLRWSQRRRLTAGPLDLPGALLAAAAGLLVLATSIHAPVVLEPMGDLVILAPVVALGLCLYLLAPRLPAPMEVAPGAPGALPSIGPAATSDPEALLRRAGKLKGVDADLHTPAREAPAVVKDLATAILGMPAGAGALCHSPSRRPWCASTRRVRGCSWATCPPRRTPPS